MKNTNIISISNKKGGVGKTTTTASLAALFDQLGYKVLVVDADPQCNLSTYFSPENNTGKTIANLFLNPGATKEFIQSCIYSTAYKNIFILPGCETMDDISDYILVENSRIEKGHLYTSYQAKTLLINAFDKIKAEYDAIIIDNTPYFNLISRNCLAASNCVLIPVESDGQSYLGLINLLKKINEVKSEVNNTLDILGVFFTRIAENTSVFKQLKNMFEAHIGEKMLDTYIRRDSKVTESASEFIPLPYYSKYSKATTDYMKLLLKLNILDKENQLIIKIRIAENLERENRRRKKVI